MVAVPDASIFKLSCKKLLDKSLKMEAGEGGRKDRGKEERTEGREEQKRVERRGEEKNDKKRKDFIKTERNQKKTFKKKRSRFYRTVFQY